MPLYTEPVEPGANHRAAYLTELEAFVTRRQDAAQGERERFFQPDTSSPEAYTASTQRYREQFKALLGWPLTQTRPDACPAVREEFVAEDDLGRIYRIWIETLPGLHTYGMLFVPGKLGEGPHPHPLVLSQHGGDGTPELCSGLYGPSNYNDMTRRILRQGAIVFAPQLLLWRKDFGPAIDRTGMDTRLKQLGGSITALEIYQLQRCLDALVTRPDVDPQRIGMVGLSYGGFYTLFTAAVETRIRAALSSCFLNDRLRYAWPDWTWNGAALTFFDAEIAALVCPRALFIEAADQDELFAVDSAREEAQRAAAYYQRLGLPDHFAFKAFPGVHELDPADDGMRFLFRHLG
jgi:dienelactone hydrolase